MLILTSEFLWWLAVFCALSFTADRALQRGVTDLAGSTVLLSIMGITNCVGRLVMGPIIDKYKSKILFFYFAAEFTLASSVIVSEFLMTFAGHAVYAGFVGFSMGALQHRRSPGGFWKGHREIGNLCLHHWGVWSCWEFPRRPDL